MMITSGDISWSIYANIYSNTTENYTKDGQRCFPEVLSPMTCI